MVDQASTPSGNWGLGKFLEIIGLTFFTPGAGVLLFEFALALTRLGDGVALVPGFYKVMLIGIVMTAIGVWLVMHGHRLMKLSGRSPI
jgi:hypothetical protein